MRRYSSKHNLQTLSELNVTPLLDLAFVLLIIFMITTPLMENSIDLLVPKSSTATGAPDPSKVLTISIDKNNSLKLDKSPITPEELESLLVSTRSLNPETAVIVRPHFELPIQQFIAVMDILQRAAITKVGVMTQREEGAKNVGAP
jgi:biopolymer transport protein ExbD